MRSWPLLASQTRCNLHLTASDQQPLVPAEACALNPSAGAAGIVRPAAASPCPRSARRTVPPKRWRCARRGSSLRHEKDRVRGDKFLRQCTAKPWRRLPHAQRLVERARNDAPAIGSHPGDRHRVGCSSGATASSSSLCRASRARPDPSALAARAEQQELAVGAEHSAGKTPMITNLTVRTGSPVLAS